MAVGLPVIFNTLDIDYDALEDIEQTITAKGWTDGLPGNDDNGALSYRFVDLVPSTPASRVRVADQPWTAPVRVAAAPAAPRVIDAELIEDEEALAVPAPRRATR